MRTKSLLPIIISILFLSLFLSSMPFQGIKLGNLTEVEHPLNALATPSSKPLFISHHATVSNEFLYQTLPANISYTLVKDWVSKNTTVLYEGVYSSNDWAINGQFNSTITPWVNHTSDPSKIIIQVSNVAGNVSIQIKKGSSLAKADYGFYQQTRLLQERFAPNKLVTFSMDYYYTPKPAMGRVPDNALAYMAVKMGDVEKNYTVLFSSLVQTTWTTISMTYNPVSFGQDLPNNVTLKMGIYMNDSETVTADQYFYIDNVEFKMWTQPNQPNLLFVRDYETGDYPYQNSSFGKGQTIIDVEKSYQGTHVVTFTIFSNMTDAIDMEISNITIISDLVKTANSTIDGVPGSTYSPNGVITWRTEWEITIPSTYFNNWLEIEKPLDWNVTHVIDGYEDEQTGQCSGLGWGSNKITIPSGIVAGGLWELEAESFNYIYSGYVTAWNGTAYENESTLFVGDIFRVQVLLNNTISLPNTLINCTINYPNGTMWWEESREPGSSLVTFSNNTVGLNLPIGTYRVFVKWTNNISILSCDKAGFLQLEFTINHLTNLTAVESYLEKVAGTPTLAKVKFTDWDLNTTIALADITFSSSYGDSGSMAYTGSGIYLSELDTSSLTVGDYYLSFNASQGFYQNQSITNLIHLRIIPESLVLQVPRTVQSCMANSYAYYKINVTGAISGSFLHPVNLTTDWFRSYNFTNYNNGTYVLNISTFEVTSGAIPETFTIKIWANKTSFGSTSDIVLLTVYPIPAQITINTTLVEVPFGESFYVKVNYTIEGSGNLIPSANCSVIWASNSETLPLGDEFIIGCNTTGLSIDVYTLVIQISHAGYETAQDSILVSITPIPTHITVNTSLLDVTFGASFYVKVNYTIEGTGTLIPNANCTVIWASTSEILPIADEFIIGCNTTGLSTGLYTLVIQVSHAGYVTAQDTISVIINPIPTQIAFNTTLVEVLFGALLYVKVNYTIEGSEILIPNANCTVIWASTSEILPIADEFIIRCNTTGLSTGLYTLIIQTSHAGYVTAQDTISVIINPIPTDIAVNNTLVEVTFGALFYVKVNYTIEGSEILIPNANCTVIWASTSQILPIADEFIIRFNTTGLSTGLYTLVIQVSHAGYVTAQDTISVIINPIPTDIAVNNTLVEVTFGASFYVKVNYTIEGAGTLIPNASCNVVWGSTSEILPIADEFIIGCNTTGLSIDVYTLIIQISHAGYVTAQDTISVIINPIPTHIAVNNTLVKVASGTSFYVKANYTIEGPGTLILNASCNVLWASTSDISPIADEYVVCCNTTGLAIDVYTLIIQISHAGYVTAQESILVIINPISTLIAVNITLVEVTSGTPFYVKANYTIEGPGTLILNASCTVDWVSTSDISPIADEFFIYCNTTGLSIGLYTLAIQISHAGYETAQAIVTVSIKPIKSEIAMNTTTLVQIDFGALFYVKVNYTIKGSETLISNASCNVIWASISDILPIGDEFIICCNTTGLSIDVYTLIIQISHPGYETAQDIISVIIKPIESELVVLNQGSIKFTLGDLVNISCRFLASGQDILDATLTLSGDIVGKLQWNGSAYYYTINTSAFSPKSYYIQIIGTQQNVKPQLKDVFFEIKPVVLQIQLPTSAVTLQKGQGNTIYLSILDTSHGTLRSDLRVVCSINGVSLELNSLPNGSFVLNLNMFELASSTTAYSLSIIVHNPYGENPSTILNVYVPTEGPDQTLMWILVIIIGVVCAVLVGLYVKNRYFRYTKFQRYILKSKNQLMKKGKIETYEEIDREKLIQELFEQEIPISKANGKKIQKKST